MEQLIHQIQNMGSNQIFTALSGAWLLGVITYLCRNIPSQIWKLFTRFYVTKITVTNNNHQFTDILEWLENNGFTKKMHSLKLCEGKEIKDRLKTIGYGKHIIWLGWTPILLELVREENSKTSADKETLYMSQLGRKAVSLHTMIGLAQRKYIPGKTRIHKYTYTWNSISIIPERSFDSVFLNAGQMQQICSTLDTFVKRKAWYAEKFIPYRLGILLYGLPGSGKTSAIKAIAAHMHKSLSILPVTKLEDIDDACIYLPEDSILVIEDIDTAPSCKPRDMDKPKLESDSGDDEDDPRTGKVGKELTEAIQGITRVHLSNILNALDGLSSTEGRILIITTNHKEDLDPALIRPGRIDLALEMNYFDEYAFAAFYKHFFKLTIDPSTFRMKHCVTGAVLQQDILDGRLSPQQMLERYTLIK